MKVPHTVSNTLMEKSLQENRSPQIRDVNIAYYMCLFNSAICLFCTSLFWTDIIPVFGTSQSLTELEEKYIKNYIFSYMLTFTDFSSYVGLDEK